MEDTISGALTYLQANDEVLANIIDNIGAFALKPSTNYYGSLVKSIISQQLSVKVVATIHARFLEELNHELSPENVLKLTSEKFKKAGISTQKKSYIVDLSSKFFRKEIDVERIPYLNDEEIINLLIKIRGIGQWSAEMFLIFCLNRMNVLPLDDLGLRRAIKLNYNLKETPSKKDVLMLSKKWGVYRSIAVWYLWQSLNKTNDLKQSVLSES